MRKNFKVKKLDTRQWGRERNGPRRYVVAPTVMLFKSPYDGVIPAAGELHDIRIVPVDPATTPTVTFLVTGAVSSESYTFEVGAKGLEVPSSLVLQAGDKLTVTALQAVLVGALFTPVEPRIIEGEAKTAAPVEAPKADAGGTATDSQTP